ncbi:MAG: hypothetical protein LBR10_08530 [Prevotellaceae bacterium]|jgi:hypothetical protein|nr:hypothetical protein [Prevotellaceae bacterium]
MNVITNKIEWQKPTHSAVCTLFLLFFVYANLVSGIFVKESNFINEYLKFRNNLFTMFVDFGLLFMIAIENFYHKYANYQQFVIIILCSFFVITTIYGHVKCYFDNSKGYISALKESGLSYALQSVSVGILLIPKYNTTIVNNLKSSLS